MIVINKQNINNFIKCPYLFGKNVLSDRYAKVDDFSKFKKYISGVASHELKENIKLSLSEYRIGFTNKHYTKNDDVLDAHSIIARLNGVFDIFANNTFFGYNIPIDIPIPGTNVVYRDIVDFGLISENDKTTIVEFDDLTNMDRYSEFLKNWPHYYIAYSFIANSLSKSVDVVIIDPVEYQKIEITFSPDRFENDLSELKDITKLMECDYLYKNLYACIDCEYLGQC